MIESLVVSNAILWVLVVVLALTVAALVRQVGILHERLAPAGALMARSGPAVGERAPALVADDLLGRPVSIGNAGDPPTLLFFVSPTCPVCKELLPFVRAIAAAEDPELRIVLASDGGEADHRAFADSMGVTPLPYVLSAELGLAYQVAKLPFAVLLDGEGVLRAKGLVNTREHVESLFEARRTGFASVQDLMAAEVGGVT